MTIANFYRSEKLWMIVYSNSSTKWFKRIFLKSLRIIIRVEFQISIQFRKAKEYTEKRKYYKSSIKLESNLK